MEKQKLVNFINKYHLNGLVSSVKWESVNRGLKVSFIDGTKTVMGLVASKGINFPAGEFGIYNTKNLLKILGVLQSETDVSASKDSIKFRDESITASYVLANPDIILEAPKAQNIPEPDFEFEINSIFIDQFIKSKSALDESTQFAFISEDGKVNLVLNHSEHPSDRITLKTGVEYDIESPILFNSNFFKEILLANKDMTSGKIFVSFAGLLICQFQGEDIASKYYLVAYQE